MTTTNAANFEVCEIVSGLFAIQRFHQFDLGRKWWFRTQDPHHPTRLRGQNRHRPPTTKTSLLNH
jgi:hypothetical protein